MTFESKKNDDGKKPHTQLEFYRKTQPFSFTEKGYYRGWLCGKFMYDGVELIFKGDGDLEIISEGQLHQPRRKRLGNGRPMKRTKQVQLPEEHVFKPMEIDFDALNKKIAEEEGGMDDSMDDMDNQPQSSEHNSEHHSEEQVQQKQPEQPTNTFDWTKVDMTNVFGTPGSSTAFNFTPFGTQPEEKKMEEEKKEPEQQTPEPLSWGTSFTWNLPSTEVKPTENVPEQPQQQPVEQPEEEKKEEEKKMEIVEEQKPVEVTQNPFKSSHVMSNQYQLNATDDSLVGTLSSQFAQSK